MSEEKPFVNVLLLGESGAGKSTFINSFANYVRQENLQEALLHDPEFCIPARFVITDQKYNETIVSVGDYKASSYKAGKSVTQEVTDYIFELNDVKLRLIDTPGVGDSRGVQQDEKNIKAIVTSIAKYRHLNAIAFVLKSNVTVLNEYFKFCIDHLLSQLDKAAYKNVIFIFTHSRGTFYRPGETLSVIQRVLKESQVDIPHSKENMFCLDNEAFRYLVAHSRGLRFTEQEAKAFEDSWNQSVACCRSLLDYIVGDGDKNAGLKPHLIKVIGEIKPKDKLQELFGFLADLSCGLDDNLEILNYFQKGVKRHFEAIPLVYFDKALPTGEAVYICRSLKCTPLQKIAERGIDVNVTSICVLNNGNTRLNCIVCKCPIDFHRSKKYLKKLMYETIVQTYEKPIKTRSTKITMLISSYECELTNVLDVLAALMIYIMQNYNCIEDPFIVYLRNEKHVDYKNLKFLYHKIKGPKETYTKIMKLEEISNGFKNLKKLNWTGRAIQTIFGDDFNINTGVTIEDKVKKIVPTTAENLQVSVANLQGKDNKNQEFNEKYKIAPKIGQKAIQLVNYGRDKLFSHADIANPKSQDANQRQLHKVQDAITKHKQSQSSTEIIKAQPSTSRGTEMEPQSINQELLNEMEKLKEENNKLRLHQTTCEERIYQLQQFVKGIKENVDFIKEQVILSNEDLNDKIKNVQQDLFNDYRGAIKEMRSKIQSFEAETQDLKLEMNQMMLDTNQMKLERNQMKLYMNQMKHNNLLSKNKRLPEEERNGTQFPKAPNQNCNQKKDDFPNQNINEPKANNLGVNFGSQEDEERLKEFMDKNQKLKLNGNGDINPFSLLQKFDQNSSEEKQIGSDTNWKDQNEEQTELPEEQERANTNQELKANEIREELHATLREIHSKKPFEEESEQSPNQKSQLEDSNKAKGLNQMNAKTASEQGRTQFAEDQSLSNFEFPNQDINEHEIDGSLENENQK